MICRMMLLTFSAGVIIIDGFHRVMMLDSGPVALFCRRCHTMTPSSKLSRIR
jgi:hypothetical protein